MYIYFCFKSFGILTVDLVIGSLEILFFCNCDWKIKIAIYRDTVRRLPITLCFGKTKAFETNKTTGYFFRMSFTIISTVLFV